MKGDIGTLGDLQHVLQNLSKMFSDTCDELKGAVTALSNSWQDDQFVSFKGEVDNVAKSKEDVQESIKSVNVIVDEMIDLISRYNKVSF